MSNTPTPQHDGTPDRRKGERRQETPRIWHDGAYGQPDMVYVASERGQRADMRGMDEDRRRAANTPTPQHEGTATVAAMPDDLKQALYSWYRARHHGGRQDEADADENLSQTLAPLMGALRGALFAAPSNTPTPQHDGKLADTAEAEAVVAELADLYRSPTAPAKRLLIPAGCRARIGYQRVICDCGVPMAINPDGMTIVCQAIALGRVTGGEGEP